MRKLAKYLSDNDALKQKWNSSYVGAPLFLFFFALWAYWHPYSHLPTPGKAIGGLAVVAGIMSVRDMKVFAKATWVGLLILLLMTEFRAIDKDHFDNEQSQKEFFDQQKLGFSDIANQANTNFAITAAGLSKAIYGLQKVLQSTQTVASAVNKTLENTTGGTSYAFVLPDSVVMRGNAASSFTLTLVNAGNAVLSGLSVAIARVIKEGAPGKMAVTDSGLAKPISAGSLGGGDSELVPRYYISPGQYGSTAQSHYILMIKAQNGTIMENLYFRPAEDGKGWAYRYELFKFPRTTIRPFKSADWVEPYQRQ